MPIDVGTPAVAVAERNALGTTARVAAWPPHRLPEVLSAVDEELAALDEQASRFRDDSEISLAQRHLARAGRAGSGDARPWASCILSEGLAEAIAVALAAAEWTGGLVDPTVGGALSSLGYDRDFAALASAPADEAAPPPPAQVPGRRSVRLDGRRLRLTAGVLLDLGATAKGLGSDRAARAAAACVPGGGVLVSLGGDIAVAGEAPNGGWPVLVADEPGPEAAGLDGAGLDGAGLDGAGPGEAGLDGAGPGEAGPDGAGPGEAGPDAARPERSGRGQPGPARARDEHSVTRQPGQLVRLTAGGLATSSILCRRWRRGGSAMHHILDPRTGLPATGPWRTVSVAAASCAEANAAATAAIVAGEQALPWLAAQGLPARLVGHDGGVRLTGGWPATFGGLIQAAAIRRMPAGPGTGTAGPDGAR